MIDLEAKVTLDEACEALRLPPSHFVSVFPEPLTIRKLVGASVFAALSLIAHNAAGARAIALDAADGVAPNGNRYLSVICDWRATGPIARWCDIERPQDNFPVTMTTIVIPADRMARDIADAVSSLRRGTEKLN